MTYVNSSGSLLVHFWSAHVKAHGHARYLKLAGVFILFAPEPGLGRSNGTGRRQRAGQKWQCGVRTSKLASKRRTCRFAALHELRYKASLTFRWRTLAVARIEIAPRSSLASIAALYTRISACAGRSARALAELQAQGLSSAQRTTARDSVQRGK